MVFLDLFSGLIITIIFEFLVYSIFIKKDYPKLILFALLINCFTWPLAMLLFGFSGTMLSLFLIEIVVFITEGILIKKLFKIGYKKALFISFIANLITASLGFLL